MAGIIGINRTHGICIGYRIIRDSGLPLQRSCFELFGLVLRAKLFRVHGPIGNSSSSRPVIKARSGARRGCVPRLYPLIMSLSFFITLALFFHRAFSRRDKNSRREMADYRGIYNSSLVSLIPVAEAARCGIIFGELPDKSGAFTLSGEPDADRSLESVIAD